jgi:hypothetical protein
MWPDKRNRAVSLLLVIVTAHALAQHSATSRSERGIIQGVVVGEGRFPAPGVMVTRQLPGQRPEHTSSDSRGRFRFHVPLGEGGGITLGAIRAFSGNLAAELPLDVHRMQIDGVLDVGAIALLPTSQLRVRVMGNRAPEPGVRVSIGRDYGVLVAEAITDSTGTVMFDGLVTVGEPWRSWFRVGALAPDGRVGSTNVTVGSVPDQVATIELIPARKFTLTILDEASGEPIAGARTEVLGTDETSTWSGPWEPVRHADRSGRAIVEAPPVARRVPVWIRAGGYEEWAGDLSPAGRVAVEIRLRRRAAQKWQVTDSPERPKDGVPIALYSIYDRQRSKAFYGMIAAGELTAPWGAPDRELGLALSSDGTFADLDHEGPVMFRRPRDVEIEVRWDDGTPASGLRLWMETPTPDGRTPRLVTDETGRVRVTALADRELSWEWQPGLSGLRRDSVDLSGGKSTFTKTLLRYSGVELRVMIDGKRQLPTDLNVGFGENILLPIAEDPANATISFQYRSTWRWQPLEIAIWGHGIDGYRRTISSAPGSHLVLDVALRSGITLNVPQSKGREATATSLESWNAESKRWGAWGTRVIPTEPRGERPVEICSVAPGIYRLTDGDDSSVTFEIPAQPPLQTLVLDVRVPRLRVRGRVTGPPGLDIGRTLVVPLAPDGSVDLSAERARRDGVAVGPDGSFDFARLASKRIRIVPWHPAASPTVPEGVLIDGAADPVELVLGPAIRSARFTADLELPAEFRARAAIRVVQLDARDHPIAELEAVGVGDAFQFANAKPGKGRLLIDPPSEFVVSRENHAPLVRPLPSRVPSIVEGITLGETVVDLGALAFSRGSTLNLAFSESWPRPLPDFEVALEALDAPIYSRVLTLRSGTEPRLEGLRKGKFRLTVQCREQYAFRFVRAIEADGEHPVTVAVESPLVAPSGK